jgi:diaminopimelate epimerase
MDKKYTRNGEKHFLVDFTKAHGNGNDFIILENLDRRYASSDLKRLAQLLCRRKFSIGADGLLVVERPESADGEAVDFAMRLFNSDGSEGEMCGNGARVLARYAFEKKLAGAAMRFTTLAGLIQARVDPPYAELDMGELNLEGSVFGQTLDIRGWKFPYVFLTAGVPHCVLLIKNREDIENREDAEKVDPYDAIDASLKREIGREISRDFARFPKGTNVSFAQMLSNTEAKAVTYERGVENLTESCGTGSVAVAVAFAIVKNTAHTFRVHNPGGVNEVRLNFAGNQSCHAWLKGKTALVARGQICEDALREKSFEKSFEENFEKSFKVSSKENSKESFEESLSCM